MRMDGSCDLSILDSFFAGIKQEEYVVKDTVFMIKSTVPIGTTKAYAEKYVVSYYCS